MWTTKTLTHKGKPPPAAEANREQNLYQRGRTATGSRSQPRAKPRPTRANRHRQPKPTESKTSTNEGKPPHGNKTQPTTRAPPRRCVLNFVAARPGGRDKH